MSGPSRRASNVPLSSARALRESVDHRLTALRGGVVGDHELDAVRRRAVERDRDRRRRAAPDRLVERFADHLEQARARPFAELGVGDRDVDRRRHGGRRCGLPPHGRQRPDRPRSASRARARRRSRGAPPPRRGRPRALAPRCAGPSRHRRPRARRRPRRASARAPRRAGRARRGAAPRCVAAPHAPQGDARRRDGRRSRP